MNAGKEHVPTRVVFADCLPQDMSNRKRVAGPVYMAFCKALTSCHNFMMSSSLPICVA